MDIRNKLLHIRLDESLLVREALLADNVALVGAAPVPLVTLERVDPDTPSPPQPTPGPEGFVGRWSAGSTGEAAAYTGRTADGSAQIELTLARQTDESWTFQLTVTNHADPPIGAVAFAPLGAIPASSCGALTLAVPHNAGWLVPAGALRAGQTIRLNYPIHASMQWTDVFTGSAGVYLACLDTEPYLKQLVIERRQNALGVVWRYSDLDIARGQTLTLPPFAIAAHPGDWWRAAELYRRWARQWMHEPDPPAWFARCPAWFWFGLKGQHAARPDRRYDQIPALTREPWALGQPVPQIAGWVRNGHDTNYPDYEAGEDMGGQDALAAAFATIHREQRRAALYTNARLIDPDSHFAARPNWQGECVHLAPCARAAAERTSGTFTGQALRAELLCERGRRTAQWDPDGKLAKEQYDRVVFAVACPGSRPWREHFLERILRLVRAYQPDGIYLDQVCGCSSLPCYAPGHEHERPALAWRGYLRLLQTLREQIRRLKPDTYLATEGVGDVFGQYIDALQAHNDWTAQVLDIGRDTPEMFRVAFPDRLLLIGPVARHQTRYLRLGHALAAGFDLLEEAVRCEEPTFRNLLGRVLALRRQLDAFIRNAEPFRLLAAESPGLRLFGLRREDPHGGGTLLIQGAYLPEPDTSPPPEEFHISLELDRSIRRAVLYNQSLDGQPIDVRRTATGLALVVPGDWIFSILLHA